MLKWQAYPVLIGPDSPEPAKAEAPDEHDEGQEEEDAGEQEHRVKTLCNKAVHFLQGKYKQRSHVTRTSHLLTSDSQQYLHTLDTMNTNKKSWIGTCPGASEESNIYICISSQ